MRLRGLCGCEAGAGSPDSWDAHPASMVWLRLLLEHAVLSWQRCPLHTSPSPSAHLHQRPLPIAQVRRTWWRGNNEEFLGRVARLAQKRKWGQLVKAFRTALDKVAAAQGEAEGPAVAAGAASGSGAAQQQPSEGGSAKKQKRGSSGKKGGKGAGGAALPADVVWQWEAFGADLAAAEAAAMAAEGGFAFAFVEGALVKAVREGWWLLLDEMNLAPAEVGGQGRGGWAHTVRYTATFAWAPRRVQSVRLTDFKTSHACHIAGLGAHRGPARGGGRRRPRDCRARRLRGRAAPPCLPAVWSHEPSHRCRRALGLGTSGVECLENWVLDV